MRAIYRSYHRPRLMRMRRATTKDPVSLLACEELSKLGVGGQLAGVVVARTSKVGGSDSVRFTLQNSAARSTASR